MSPWHLIRDRTAAKARAVRFVFVKVHQRWLKLRSAGAMPHAACKDDDDAREIRGNALLVAAGWRPGLHVPLSIWGLRDQLTSAGKATAMGAEVTAMEVQVEVQACPDPGNVGGRRTGRTGGSDGADTTPQRPAVDDVRIGAAAATATPRYSGGGDSSVVDGRSTCGSIGEESNSNSNSGTGGLRQTNRFSFVARGEVVDPVTRRLLTACNTDWRVQPNAIDMCKAPTAAQVPRS